MFSDKIYLTGKLFSQLLFQFAYDILGGTSFIVVALAGDKVFDFTIGVHDC